MDPDNPVVALCSQGMQAEAQRDHVRALALFQRAWQARGNDYEAAVAAHFVARHQTTPENALTWNQRALDHAQAAPAAEVSELLPSLYLNLAHSHEVLDQIEAARKYERLGRQSFGSLPESDYTEVVRDGLARLHERLAE